MSELMPRPSLRDEYVRRRAAELILPEVIGWMRPDFQESQREAITKDLMAVASQSKDGFELAKELERLGWAVGAQLVDILDGGWVSDAIRELTAQWVRCLKIVPALQVGEPVSTDFYDRKGQTGTIVGIDTDLARYHVRFPDMKGTSYYVVDYERCPSASHGDRVNHDLTPLPAPPPAADREHVNRQIAELLALERTFPPGTISTYDEKGDEIAGAK